MRILTVVGARPQFIKAGPLSAELRRTHTEILVHTGQHYDQGMSDVFFRELGIPAPDHHLGIGGGSHGEQTGAMLPALERLMIDERPDLVLVYGDTNSTLAGALAAAKLTIPVAHVEAGLRSFNRAMPEEINRVVSDQLSSWLFPPSEVSRAQLASEGITDRVHVVGDIMLDAILAHQARAAATSHVLRDLGFSGGGYYLCTVHRAENADDSHRLARILSALDRLDLPVVVPLHPRTRKRLGEFALAPGGNIRLLDPVGYLDMLELERQSACVLTDSGGVQKEAYYLGVPCVTLRDETEWVETVAAGWNVLAGTDPDRIVAAATALVGLQAPRPPVYGTGDTARRIAAVLAEVT
ncbi:MAG: UDP-N-acetylglucosamine 2-epimerase (non-hydrolyzing) [Gemmatimonadales bacterium]|nr:UDP-N-acetylglucosamine 2-epimerase (non-hydrolyzing) [Gemmatimonadales bacterium]